MRSATVDGCRDVAVRQRLPATTRPTTSHTCVMRSVTFHVRVGERVVRLLHFVRVGRGPWRPAARTGRGDGVLRLHVRHDAGVVRQLTRRSVLNCLMPTNASPEISACGLQFESGHHAEAVGVPERLGCRSDPAIALGPDHEGRERREPEAQLEGFGVACGDSAASARSIPWYR